MIAWQKQGRKKKQPALALNKEEQYTKEEKRVVKNGVVSIAAAVIKQWILDGRPKCDMPGIMPWINILKQYYHEDDMKKMLNVIPGGNI